MKADLRELLEARFGPAADDELGGKRGVRFTCGRMFHEEIRSINAQLGRQALDEGRFTALSIGPHEFRIFIQSND